MVSKASDDLPLPEMPVMTTNLFFGMDISTFFRLCSFAPNTSMNSSAPFKGVPFVFFIRFSNQVSEDKPQKSFAKNFRLSEIKFQNGEGFAHSGTVFSK